MTPIHIHIIVKSKQAHVYDDAGRIVLENDARTHTQTHTRTDTYTFSTF